MKKLLHDTRARATKLKGLCLYAEGVGVSCTRAAGGWLIKAKFSCAGGTHKQFMYDSSKTGAARERANAIASSRTHTQSFPSTLLRRRSA